MVVDAQGIAVASCGDDADHSVAPTIAEAVKRVRDMSMTRKDSIRTMDGVNSSHSTSTSLFPIKLEAGNGRYVDGVLLRCSCCRYVLVQPIDKHSDLVLALWK